MIITWIDLLLTLLCAIGGVLIVISLIVGALELTYWWETRHLHEFTRAAKRAQEEGRLL